VGYVNGWQATVASMLTLLKTSFVEEDDKNAVDELWANSVEYVRATSKGFNNVIVDCCFALHVV
jgi:hypothetical protein